MKKWTPRGSAIGYYYGCQMRAAYDRMMAEHPEMFSAADLAAVEAKKSSSGYADLGTVIHHRTQKKLLSEWPGGEEAPSEAQLLNAGTVFKGNAAARDMAIEKASTHLAKVIGPDPDGRNWMAEVSVKRPWITGHIDLLSSNATELLDIKTTSKPPYYSHVPPSHVLQTLAYTQALSEMGLHVKKIRIVYIASTSVDWYMECVFDPTTDDMMMMRADLVAFGKRLKSAGLLKPGGAVPNIGDACENWCPYTTLCRDKYAVKKGDQKPVDPPQAPVKGMSPFGASMPVAGKHGAYVGRVLDNTKGSPS